MSNDISNYNNWLDAWNDFYEKEKDLVELDPNAALVSSVDAEGNPNAVSYTHLTLPTMIRV